MTTGSILGYSYTARQTDVTPDAGYWELSLTSPDGSRTWNWTTFTPVGGRAAIEEYLRDYIESVLLNAPAGAELTEEADNGHIHRPRGHNKRDRGRG